MDPQELSLVKLDNQNEVISSFFQDAIPLGIWDPYFPYAECFNLGVPGFLEFEPLSMTHQMSSHTSRIELNDFEEISCDLSSWDFDLPSSAAVSVHNSNSVVNPNKPAADVLINNHISDHQLEDVPRTTFSDSGVAVMSTGTHSHDRQLIDYPNLDRTRNVRYKSSGLQLEEIQKYFDVPITRAAKELNVGLTVLKKRCRELNIRRWPHRKIKSLKSLIHNVKELGLGSKEIEMLEEHKRMVEKVPAVELTERTKKLRQACFKANYKKRRSLQQQQQQTSLCLN